MLNLTLILVAAAIGHGIARWRGLPAIPLMVAMGLVLGVTGVLGPAAGLRDTLLLGLTFLMFVVGAELDPSAIRRRWRAAMLLAVVQFAFIGGLGLLAARLLEFPPRTAVFVALAVASSSTLVVVAMLRRREQVFEDTGRMALAVVLIQDLLVILLLPAVTAESAAELAGGVGATLLLLGMAAALSLLVMPRAVPRLEFDEEPLLLLVLATLFVFVGAASWMGLPPVVGAFIAGFAVCRFPVNALVRGPVASLSDFFLALFFVTLGATIEFSDPRQVLLDAVLLGSLLVFAPLLLVPIARRLGLSARSSIEVTGLLAQCGELGIAVMLVGVAGGYVDQASFDTIVVVAVATLLLAPVLSSDAATWRLMRRVWRPRLRGVEMVGGSASSARPVLFLGCGTSTRRLIRRLREDGHPVLAVDDDAGVVAALREEGVSVVRGDGADARLLRELGAGRASVIVSTMRRQADQRRLLAIAGSVPVVIRTFDASRVRGLEARGAIVVSEADAAAEAFLVWFDGDSSLRETEFNADSRSSLR